MDLDIITPPQTTSHFYSMSLQNEVARLKEHNHNLSMILLALLIGLFVLLFINKVQVENTEAREEVFTNENQMLKIELWHIRCLREQDYMGYRYTNNCHWGRE